MGRGNSRASSADGGAARKKWYQQKIKQHDPGKVRYKDQNARASRINALRDADVLLKTSPNINLRGGKDGWNTNVKREIGRFRAQAYREAQRKGMKPEAAKAYANKRVKELRDRQLSREQRAATRKTVENRKRQDAREKGWSRHRIGYDSKAELEANIKGRPERAKRAANKRRERIRQQARRRAAGQESRALKTLRRPTPADPHLRPARRRRQHLTERQREQNARQRGRYIRERNREWVRENSLDDLDDY